MPTHFTRIAATAALAAVLGACPENKGNEPPSNSFFFPTGAALHRGTDGEADFLYVVNADFDLSFNGSTVVAVQLSRVRERRNMLMGMACPPPRQNNSLGCHCDSEASGAWLCDESFGQANPAAGAVGSLVRSDRTRKLNPYAGEAAIGVYHPNPNPDAGVSACADGGADGGTDAGTAAPPVERLYVLVRGGNSLAWFDVKSDGEIDCDAPDSHTYCAASHYAGNDPSQSHYGAVLPQEESSLSVEPEHGWIVVAHQSFDPTLAHASILLDPAATTSPGRRATAPTVQSVLTGTASGLSALALLPRACGSGDRSTWIATSRTTAALTLLQAYPGDSMRSDARVFVYQAASAPITGLNNGSDSRAITLDPHTNRTAYVVSRRPEALLTVDISNPAAPTVTDAISLPAGPSRAVAVWHPELSRTYVYTVSYDARWIYVVDPSEHRVIAQIPSHRGPHTILYDDRERLLYVVDFIDASVEMIDARPSTGGVPNPNFNHRVFTFGYLGRL